MTAAVVRRLAIVAMLGIAWQVYAMWLKNPLILPTLTATLDAGWRATLSGELPHRVVLSMRVLLAAYAVGIALGLALAVFAELTRFGGDLLVVLTAMFTPLPGIALMPVALLWFGLGPAGFVFVVIHAVVWPVAINAHSGFAGVPPTLRLVGRNYGLGGWRLTLLILMPAAVPSILTGLRVGWAFAWRTLIAAELVFGVATGSGGLGWYVFQARNAFAVPDVFAGLATVAIIGLIFEGVIFHMAEALTLRRWGLQR